MERDLAARIIGLAVKKGRLNQQDVDLLSRDAVGGRANDEAGVLEILLAGGVLTKAEVEDLSREADDSTVTLDAVASVTVKEPPASATLSPGNEEKTLRLNIEADSIYHSLDAATSGQISIQLSDKKQCVGRFELLELLGEGGMGSVYRAFDPMLQRYLAVKVIHGRDPESMKRLLLEGRAQAKIDHPNVCRVYEVGEADGQSYVAMQYIDGVTLNKALDKMTLEQKVRVIADAAEGLHAAHREGLIHRDIKPQNIMVERTEDGQWKPYVMDFGLVREEAKKGITVTGAVLGTPTYMAPEQAAGRWNKMDRRSDVYSLGATLYEALAGQPPFEGFSAMDVMMKVLKTEPVMLRKLDPALPVQLETIVAKCLEKDLARRYESAKALANDLRSFLEGERIQAQPASLAYRILKKARQHKLAVSVAAVVLIALTVTVTVSIYLRIKTVEQTRLAQQLGQEFGQKVREMEAIMRIAYLVPLHDTRREQQLIRSRIKDIEDIISRLGPVAAGPGHYAIGRGYLALREYTQAREHLELAWKHGYRAPEVAYTLGLVMGSLYQLANEDLMKLDLSARAARKQEIKREYRDPALNYLKMSGGIEVEAPAFVEGLIAFYEERYDEALTKSLAAFQQQPTLHEAKRLTGDIHVAVATDFMLNGQYDKAKELLRLAGEDYAEAIEIGESDPAVYECECERQLRLLEIEIDAGIAGESAGREAFHNALAACDKALVANPVNAVAYSKKSGVYWRWGEYQVNYGQDPRATLSQAIEMGEQAVRCDGKKYEAYNGIGNAFFKLGDYEMEQGGNPLPSLDKAIENYLRSVAINPGYSQAYNGLGLAYCKRGNYEQERGLDPLLSFQRSIDYFERSIAIAASNVDYTNLGISYWSKGKFEMENGLDPQASLDRAIESLKRSIALNANNSDAYISLGISYNTKGEYQLKEGRDPNALLALAIENYQRALAINESDLYAHFNLAVALNMQAIYLCAQGSDPSAALSRARAALTTAMALNSADADLYTTWCETELVHIAWLTRNHLSPAESIARAERYLQRSLKLNAQNAEAYGLMAELCRQQAQWQLWENSRPVAEINRGLAMARRAIAINPRLARAFATKGTLHLLQARAVNAKRKEQARLALADLEQAIKLNRLLQREYQPFADEARKYLVN